VQEEEPAPYDGWAGWQVMLAIQVTAQHGYPQYGLLQRRGVLWQVRRALCVAIQRLPFDRLQQHFAAQVRAGSRQQGRDRMRQAMTANRAVALTNRSSVPNCRASIRQPLFRTRCHVSIVQRRAYQASRSSASTNEVVGTELRSIHSRGSTRGAGASSIA